jgi:hypothetical protein
VPTPPKTTKTPTKPTHDVRNHAEMMALIGPDAEDRAAALAGIVDGLFTRTGDLEAFGDLAAGLVYTTVKFAEEAAQGLTQAALDRAQVEMGKEVTEALALASEAEAKAARMETALQKADAALEKAKTDCAAALDRAKIAEAEAAELRSALAPLRALLATADK